MIWNQGIWNCILETIKQNWIKTTLENKVDQQAIIIYNIYVPNHCRDKDSCDKDSCWHDLKDSLDAEENTNIILGGDFNLILHANEKSGGSFTPDPYRIQLENIMQEHDLLDVPPKNHRYTWNNYRMGAGNIVEWLDRILINITLLSAFSF